MTQADSVHSTPPTNTSKTTRASQVDPIFAAIDNHRKLFKAWNALYDAIERAESKANKKHGRRPWSLVAWRNYSAIGGSEIEDRREEFLTARHRSKKDRKGIPRRQGSRTGRQAGRAGMG
jgi:hypothetical protein